MAESLAGPCSQRLTTGSVPLPAVTMTTLTVTLGQSWMLLQHWGAGQKKEKVTLSLHVSLHVAVQPQQEQLEYSLSLYLLICKVIFSGQYPFKMGKPRSISFHDPSISYPSCKWIGFKESKISSLIFQNISHYLLELQILVMMTWTLNKRICWAITLKWTVTASDMLSDSTVARVD